MKMIEEHCLREHLTLFHRKSARIVFPFSTFKDNSVCDQNVVNVSRAEQSRAEQSRAEQSRAEPNSPLS